MTELSNRAAQAPTIGRALTLTAITRIVAMVASVSSSMLTTYLAITYLGAPTFGTVATLVSLTALIPFMDLGLGAVLTNEASSSSREALLAAFRAAFRHVGRFGIGLFVVVIALLPTGFWQAAVPSDSLSNRDLGWAIAAVALLFGLNAPLSLGQRVLLGLHLNHVVAITGVVQSAVTLSVTFALTATGAPGWTLATTLLSGQLVFNLVLVLVCCRRLQFRLLTLVASVWSRLDANVHLATTAVPAVLSTVATSLALQNDRLLLIHFSGERDVALYALNAIIYASGWGLLYTVGLTLWPIIRARSSSADQDGLRRLIVKSWLGFVVVGLLAGTVYGIASSGVVALLSGGEVEQTDAVSWAFASLAIAQAAYLVPNMIWTSAQGFRFQALLSLLMLILNVPLSILLAIEVGPAGPVIASTVAILVVQVVPSAIATARRRSFRRLMSDG